MSFFDKIGDSAKWVGDRFSDLGHWADDVWHGNVGTQSVPAPELVQKIQQSRGATGWHDGGNKAKGLAKDHDLLSSDINKLSSGLESMWTGNGAEAAQARIKMFSAATTAASQTYTSNGENLTGLANGFDDMKAALQPMPGTPPHKDFLDVATPWDTDTEDKINQYNQLAAQNLARYQSYADQAQSSGQSLQNDYGKLNDFDDNLAITQATKVKVEKHTHKTTSDDDKTKTSRTEVDPPRITTPPPNTPPPTTPPPTTPPPNIPPPVVPPPTGRPIDLPGRKPPEDERPGWRPGDDDDDSTQKSGLDDPTVKPPGQRFPVGSGNPSWSSTGGGADGFGPGGFGVGAGAGAGGAGGSGAFGSGSSGRGGIGSRLSGGAGSGAFSEEGARGGAMGGRGAMAGATGAKGSPGMGGAMGAAGNKGKGEEDAEHQRKYGIDDDSAFTLIDDADGRLLDPHTGLPPTPPTIGA